LRGVSESTEVVFYEDNSGMRAARGLWFLEFFGHQNVRILDGGIQAWKAAGFAVTTEAASPKTATFKSSERREVLATVDDVLHSAAFAEARQSRQVRAGQPSPDRD